MIDLYTSDYHRESQGKMWVYIYTVYVHVSNNIEKIKTFVCWRIHCLHSSGSTKPILYASHHPVFYEPSLYHIIYHITGLRSSLRRCRSSFVLSPLPSLLETQPGLEVNVRVFLHGHSCISVCIHFPLPCYQCMLPEKGQPHISGGDPIKRACLDGIRSW